MASNTISTKVKIEGEKEYRRAIKDINSELGKFNAESKRLASELKAGANALKNAKEQQENYKSRIKEVNKTIAEQEGVIKKTKKAIEENGDETGELTRKLNNFEAELEKSKKRLADLKTELAKVPNSMTIVGTAMQDVGNKMKASGQSIANVGRQLTTLTAPLVAAGAAAIKFGAEFDATMSSVRAVMNPTEEGFRQLRESAISWGEKTVYSAREAGDALYYMGLAGWSAEESMNSLGGVLNLAAAGSLDLGRTSDIVTDAMTAMHIAADGMTNGIANAEHFSNVLAATMSNSNTTVDLMGETFKYVAPVAGSLGYSIEDLSLSIGLMANAGIKGSTAGTTLRNILTRMAKPTEEVAAAMDNLGVSLSDADGNTLPFVDLLKDLRVGFRDLKDWGANGEVFESFMQDVADLDKQLEKGVITEAEYEQGMESLLSTVDGATQVQKLANASAIAGQRGLSGLMAIVTATDEEFDALYNTLLKSDEAFNGMGYAAGMAETQMDNLQGDFTKFTSALGTAQIKMSDIVSKSLRKFVQGLTDLVVKFNNLRPSMQAFYMKLAGIAIAAGPVLLAYGKLKAGLGTLLVSLGGAVKAFGTFKAALDAQMTTSAAFAVAGINPVVLGLKALAVAAGVAIAASELHKAKVKAEAEALYGLDEAQQQAVDSVNKSSEAFNAWNDTLKQANSGVQQQYGAIDTMVERYNSLIESNGQVREGQEGYAQFLLGEMANALGVETSYLQEQIDKNGQLGASIDTLIEKKKQQAILDANYDSYVEALRNQSQAQQDYANAMAASEEANRKLAQAEAEYNAVASDPKLGPAARGQQLKDLQIALDTATASQQEANTALESSKTTMEGYASVITNYEAAQQAVANGTADMSDKILALSNNLLTATTSDAASLQTQYENFKTTYDNMKAAVDSGSTAITEKQLSEMGRLVKLSKTELDKLPGVMTTAGNNAKTGFERSMNGAATSAGNKARQIKSSVESNIKGDTTYAGNMTVAGYLGALDGAIAKANYKAQQIATTTQNALKKSMDIKSPSRVMKKIGAYVGEGYVLGIESQMNAIRNASLEMADSTLGNIAASNQPAVSKSVSAPISVAVNVNGNVDDADLLAQRVADIINDQVIRRNEVFA